MSAAAWRDPQALAGLARSLAIYRAQPWRGRTLRRHYARLIGPGALVFDIGAHAGDRSRAALACGARVVAVEPQPLFAALLRWEARRRGGDLAVVQAACGAAEGTAHLHVSRRHPTVSSMAPDWIASVAADAGFARVAWDRTDVVRTITLDALIAAHGRPDFVKIDVEGAEAAVLAGLSAPLPLLSFEWTRAAPGGARAAIDRLEALGPHRYAVSPGESRALGEWIGPDALRAALHGQPDGPAFGDVYARHG